MWILEGTAEPGSSVASRCCYVQVSVRSRLPHACEQITRQRQAGNQVAGIVASARKQGSDCICIQSFGNLMCGQRVLPILEHVKLFGLIDVAFRCCQCAMTRRGFLVSFETSTLPKYPAVSSLLHSKQFPTHNPHTRADMSFNMQSSIRVKLME
jgi:hypothetical protein